MDLKFNKKIAKDYRSLSQIARVLTEDWVGRMSYCPNCGSGLAGYENNRPVADFYCKNCNEEYELKSKKNSTGKKIVDGAYGKMIERLQDQNNPNFFFLNYSPKKYEVINFAVIPKHFFVPTIIEKRKPLLPKAKRAGWIGCNILLEKIPKSGKIFYVQGGQVKSRKDVLEHWKKTLFLRNTKKHTLKGWILDIMNCIDELNKSEFTLQEIYKFENILRTKHPSNKYIKDKIRQQLQFLRDKGYVEFLGDGKYKLL